MTAIRKVFVGTLAAAAAMALTASASLAKEHFVGTWKVKDTAGTEFNIVLSKDGTASADRGKEGLHGKWSEKDGAAVIKWDTGWTTKITKHGKGYKKTAYEGEKEKNTSEAVKSK